MIVVSEKNEREGVEFFEMRMGKNEDGKGLGVIEEGRFGWVGGWLGV